MGQITDFPDGYLLITRNSKEFQRLPGSLTAFPKILLYSLLFNYTPLTTFFKSDFTRHREVLVLVFPEKNEEKLIRFPRNIVRGGFLLRKNRTRQNYDVANQDACFLTF